MFEAAYFLAELTPHIPLKRVQLMNRYELYSSRIKGNWDNILICFGTSPPGWKVQHGMSVQVCDAENLDPLPDDVFKEHFIEKGKE